MSSKKKLFIVYDDSDLSRIAASMPDAEYLAVSLIAMQALDSQKISYRVIEAFSYQRSDYGAIQCVAREIEKYFSKVDALLSEVLGYSRAFQSNLFWFVHRLLDLDYIGVLANTLESKYDEITIVNGDKIPVLPRAHVSLQCLNLSVFQKGLVTHFLCYLKHGLKKSNSLSAPAKWDQGDFASGFLKEPLLHLAKRLPSILLRRYKKKSALRKAEKKAKKEGTLLLMQDGYDVDVVREKCPVYQYQKFNPQLLNKHALTRVDFPPGLEKNVTDLLAELCSEKFPRYSQWLSKLMREYVTEVVSYIPSLRGKIAEYLQQINPKKVLYSKGIETLVDDLVASEANQHNIEVCCFIHGGPENTLLPEGILDRYFEQNRFIPRTVFVYNKAGQNKFRDNKVVNPIVSGPLSILRQPVTPRKTKPKILYCMGVTANYTFKEIRKCTTDYEKYLFISDLVSACSKENVSIDIRPHPAVWEQTYPFVKKLIHANKKSCDIGLSSGGSVEQVLSSYDCIVLDMISSRVLFTIARLKKPTIIYIPDDFEFNQETFPSFSENVYLARKENLGSLIKQFSEGKLNSRWQDAYLKTSLAGNHYQQSISEIQKYFSV